MGSMRMNKVTVLGLLAFLAISVHATEQVEGIATDLRDPADTATKEMDNFLADLQGGVGGGSNEHKAPAKPVCNQKDKQCCDASTKCHYLKTVADACELVPDLAKKFCAATCNLCDEMYEANKAKVQLQATIVKTKAELKELEPREQALKRKLTTLKQMKTAQNSAHAIAAAVINTDPTKPKEQQGKVKVAAATVRQQTIQNERSARPAGQRTGWGRRRL